MPWLIEAFSDGRKTDNRGGSEVQISRRPGGWDAEVFLPCSRRADDRMKLPFYFLLIRQNQTIGKEDRNYCWPPSRVVPRLRLNFSIYSPENFGCFPETTDKSTGQGCKTFFRELPYTGKNHLTGGS